MKKLKIIGIVLLVFVLVAGGTFYIFRTQIKKHFIPTIQLEGDINIKVKNDTSYISAKVSVNNKTFLKIKIDTLKYTITLFDKVYMQSEKYINLTLQGYHKDTIDLSVKVPYMAIIKDLKEERKKEDSIDCSINIFLQYATFFGRSEKPINKSTKIKIPQPPELEIVEIKYSKIHLKTILADAKIKIINHSALNLAIKDISYNMNISEQGNLKGNYKEPVYIKPNETTYITLPIKINVNNIGKTVFQIIVNKDNYDYTLTLKAILESTDPFKESFNIDIAKSGKMELRK